MIGSVKCAGVRSLGLVQIAAASYSSFGLESSLLGIFVCLVTNLICVQSTASQRMKSTPLGSWMEQLALLCWVSAGCSSLSNYLDYFDDVQHHSYLHLVPIDVFPRVMPLVVVFVVSALFALGLEASHFLNVLSTVLFWITFVLYTATSLLHYQNNIHFQSVSGETITKSVLGAAIWFPFTGCKEGEQLNRSKEVLISSVTYAIALVMFSSLDLVKPKGGRLSLMEPLSSEHSWYLMLQVPLVSCCLVMAIYQLYLPALDNVAHKSFVPRLSRDSRLTGTKLGAVTVIGIYCWSLIYIYSSGRLVLIGAASVLVAKSADSLNAIWKQRSPIASYDRTNNGATRKKAKHVYSSLKSIEGNDDECGLLSSDSGHSTDTDIDEIVQEYKFNTEVMRGIDSKKPTKRSSIIVSVMLLFTTVMSIMISRDLLSSSMTSFPWYFIGIAVSAIVLHLQPIRLEENSFSSFLNLLVLIVTTVLFGVIIVSVWTPVLLWALLGAVFYFLNDIGKAVSKMKSTTTNSPSEWSLPQLPPPKIEIRLQAIQIRSKPI